MSTPEMKSAESGSAAARRQMASASAVIMLATSLLA